MQSNTPQQNKTPKQNTKHHDDDDTTEKNEGKQCYGTSTIECIS